MIQKGKPTSTYRVPTLAAHKMPRNVTHKPMKSNKEGNGNGEMKMNESYEKGEKVSKDMSSKVNEETTKEGNLVDGQKIESGKDESKKIESVDDDDNTTDSDIISIVV